MTNPSLLVGGESYPIAAQATGATLLPVVDKWLSIALPYFQACLSAYLDTAYRAAMAGQVPTSVTTNAACQETAPVDPEPFFADTNLMARAPLLAIFPKSSVFKRLTLEKDDVVTTYGCTYVLPAATWDQARRVGPILQAVLGLLIEVTKNQQDPNYNGGQLVWDAAGTQEIWWKNASYGFFLDPKNAGHYLPALMAEIEVTREDAQDLSQAIALTYMNTAIGVSDDGSAQLPAFVNAQTNVG